MPNIYTYLSIKLYRYIEANNPKTKMIEEIIKSVKESKYIEHIHDGLFSECDVQFPMLCESHEMQEEDLEGRKNSWGTEYSHSLLPQNLVDMDPPCAQLQTTYGKGEIGSGWFNTHLPSDPQSSFPYFGEAELPKPTHFSLEDPKYLLFYDDDQDLLPPPPMSTGVNSECEVGDNSPLGLSLLKEENLPLTPEQIIGAIQGGETTTQSHDDSYLLKHIKEEQITHQHTPPHLSLAPKIQHPIPIYPHRTTSAVCPEEGGDLEEHIDYILKTARHFARGKGRRSKAKENKKEKGVSRKRKSCEQLQTLEETFKVTTMWTHEQIVQLSESTGLSELQVYKWSWDQKRKIPRVE